MLKVMLLLEETTLVCVLMATTFMCLEGLCLALDIMIYIDIHFHRIDGNVSSRTILIMNLRNLKISQFLDLD